ncbi:MAG: hypothetical protein O3A02_00185 [bacterium]|nr:hypothetical protein [bacterium]
MTTTLLLLALFLAVVVVGGTLVALYDAAERLWSGRLEAAAVTPVRRRQSGRRVAPPAAAWRHLH